MPPLQRRDVLCLVLLLAWGLAWLAPGLGHPAIHDWDEALHQAAARGTAATPLTPHLYAEPLHRVDPRYFWEAGVWLHKPVAPFWAGALMLRLLGTTPLALRLGSLLGVLGAAAAVFLLVRGLAGRAWALLGAAGFLALPFTWILVQGLMFGDVTDTTLTGWVTLAVLLLCWAVERESDGWMAAAGAAVGVAFLCKSVLALAPLGVACVLWGLARLGVCRGPSTRGLLAMGAVAVAVAAPWNLYAAHTWPDAYLANLRNTLGHVPDGSGEDVGPWRRPWDATLNEMVAGQLRPVPGVVGLLVLGFLCVRAVRRREHVVVALALWLAATWAVHSVVSVKAPGLAWNVVPAVFAGLALLARDAQGSLPLALALPAALATPWWVQQVPALGRLRQALPPDVFVQTRTLPGLVEGGAAVLAAVGLGLLLARLLRRAAWVPRALGALAAAALGLVLLWQVPRAHAEQVARERPRLGLAYSREVGLALDGRVPARSVLFLDIDYERAGTFEPLRALFWSGRMAYRGAPDVARARARGFHPYLLSPAAEPFAPVEGVPAHAWLRAYDVEVPAPPPPLPAGATPLAVRAGPLEVLGWATGPLDAEADRWAFFVRAADGEGGPLRVVFHTAAGPEAHTLAPEDALRTRARLARAPWYVLPAVGPRRRDVRALELGPSGARISLASP